MNVGQLGEQRIMSTAAEQGRLDGRIAEAKERASVIRELSEGVCTAVSVS